VGPHRLLLATALLGALVVGAAPGASAHGRLAPAPCPKNIVETAVAAGTVVSADIQAKNGVIHAIDTVLMPPAS
jgi:uncharacterized surface protein with fasciclin (FAS1) repeats